jgi:hypothetical protein
MRDQGPPPTLRTVLDALGRGAATLDDVARSASLSQEMVRLAVDQLVTLGLLDARPLAAGCPADGCGGCAAGPPGQWCVPAGRGVPLALSVLGGVGRLP